MFRNYFKTTWRNLWKNKASSAINITGLIIGLTGCLLIALYIQHELSYDTFQQKRHRIARVIMEYSFNGGATSAKGNYTSVRVAPVFKRNFPEITAAVKMYSQERVIGYNDKLFTEKKVAYADPGFFELFSFKLLQGNAQTALALPGQIILTQSAAAKYFGNENPLGKSLRVGNDSIPYAVTGVIQDCPSNSQIKFDFLASFASLGITPDYEDTYWDANYTTYLLLKDQSSIAGLQAKLPAFMKKEMAGQPGTVVNFYLEPFESVHLYSPYTGFEPNSSITYIFILAAVAVLILVVACSTYINLSTARSIERAKEVGVRKVIGAGKQQLFFQFIGESALLCVLAVVLSLGMASLLLPSFNRLSGRELSFRSLFSFPFMAFSLALALVISFLAGSYPAVILTKFQPVKVLKGPFKNTGSAQWLRKSLIVFQFGISVFLVLSAFIVQRQLHFIQNKKLGYNRDHVLVLPLDDKMIANIDVIKNEFKSDPGVVSVSRCGRTPVEGGGGYNMRTADMPEDQQLAVTANPVDEDFVVASGMQLIAGQDLSKQDLLDIAPGREKKEYHFILNESAVRQLGWKSPQEAVGQKMLLDNSRPGVVKGVVKDFHFESLHNPIKPFVLFPRTEGRKLMVKLKGDHIPQTIAFLESKWKTLVPHRPFDFHFMDEDYTQLYNAENRLGKVMDLFAGLAIVLACFGLFGLSSYTTRQRIKEIAVRKVLGASVQTIVIGLSKEFVWLTVIAIVIAFPLAGWATSRWLQDFSYRTGVSWGLYALTAVLTLFCTLLTVSVKTIQAALTNPVKNLRTE